MRTIGVTEFKAKCLSLIKEVEATGEGLTITLRGRPIVDLQLHSGRVLSETDAERRERYRPGRFAHMGEIIGDIVAPFDEPWEALMDDPLADRADDRAA